MPFGSGCFHLNSYLQINFDGIEALCADLGVDANDISVFIFAWHCQATTLGEFGWDEFRRGAEELRIDSIASFKGGSAKGRRCEGSQSVLFSQIVWPP